VRRPVRTVPRQKQDLTPISNAVLFPGADIPLGTAFEYFFKPVVLDAVAVYQQALAEDSPLTLIEQHRFARDVLDHVRRAAPPARLARSVGWAPRGPIRLTFDD
jgi:hypothetical protein